MKGSSPHSSVLAQTSAALGYALVLFALFSGKLTLWGADGVVITNNGWPLFAAGLLLLSPALLLAATKIRFKEASLLAGSAFLLLLFFSSWLSNDYNLLRGVETRGEILLVAFITYAIFRSKLSFHPVVLILFAASIFAISFYQVADGRLLTTDDHSTFYYRLALLKSEFPKIPFFNPLWNGGIDQRDFFATGALNFFLLFSPLIYLLDLEQSYNLLITLLLFGVLPGSSFVASRMLGLSNLGATLSAVLAVSSSRLWYQWALGYGTLGFITSTSLTPIVIALAIRALDQEKQLKPWEAILAVVFSSLLLCWTPAGLALLPLIVLGLKEAVLSFGKPNSFLKRKYIVAICAGLIVINTPWISLFWSASSVSKFLDAEKTQATHTHLHQKDDAVKTNAPKTFKTRSGSLSITKTVKHLREAASSANPLILAFALPGLLLISGATRSTFVLLIPWLITLGAILPPLKPQLELDRMLIILTVCCAIPAAAALSATIEKAISSALMLLSSCVASGFLIAAVFSTNGILLRRSLVSFNFADPTRQELIRVISEVPTEGRILFSGFALHDLSGGHLAPLAVLSGKPLIASSPVHNLWKYKQVFPKDFIGRGDAGIDQYLNLYNVTHVFAHERKWRDYFGNRSQKFTQIWAYERYSLFKRNSVVSNYFLEGEGKVVGQSVSQVELKLYTQDAVLKFNYFPFLRTSNCKISEQIVDGGLSFIKLSACDLERPVIIDSVGPFERLLLSGGRS